MLTTQIPKPLTMKMIKHPQISRLLALLMSGTLTSTQAQTLLWSDNFDHADTTNFDGSSLTGRLSGPLGSLPTSGSFHLYGLTNEVIPQVSTDLIVTGVSRDASNNFIINFKGAASTTYDVTKSPDLVTPFGPLTTPLTTTTDAAGVGQAIIPATETTDAREFYRIEE